MDFMKRSKWTASRLMCAFTASTFLLGSVGCGKDDPTPPVGDPECVVPTVSNFVDSAQARVVIRNYSFQPASITIKAGQTVKWKHCGPELDAHTVTSDAAATQTLDSPFIPLNGTYSRTFDAAGSNPYHCTPHPDMQGTVTVVPATVPSPRT
jgi:plastocyanin